MLSRTSTTGFVPMIASGKLGAEAPPRSPVNPTELKMMRVVDPVPPLAKIPTVRSGSRALLIMPETMLFTIVVGYYVSRAVLG